MKMLMFPYKKYFLTSDLEEKICVHVHIFIPIIVKPKGFLATD